jgi:ATP-dependent DNA helicase RecQ
MNHLLQILQKYWGFSSFLPYQEEIIGAILEGRDVLSVMATGGGKSLCYQLPAVYFGGMTLVISPLISLMKDQVDDLNGRNIPAAAYTSALTYHERAHIESCLKEGSLRLLFVSPEKCIQKKFFPLLRNTSVRLIAIDEAHCISEWGHNFRPEYRQLIRLRNHFPDVPIIALTATAAPDVRRDIIRQLGLTSVSEFTGSFNRENHRYYVIAKKNPLIFLHNYLGTHRNDPGIIFCMSKKESEEIATYLKKRGFCTAAYHAGLTRHARESIQEAFLNGSVPVICATIAFGMGIDKPNVRYVIHYSPPKSPESYYQETGRAGRDGRNSECILLYSREDITRIRGLLEQNAGGAVQLRNAYRKLEKMTEYCESGVCKRKFLLEYFGEGCPSGKCRSCDGNMISLV